MNGFSKDLMILVLICGFFSSSFAQGEYDFWSDWEGWDYPAGYDPWSIDGSEDGTMAEIWDPSSPIELPCGRCYPWTLSLFLPRYWCTNLFNPVVLEWDFSGCTHGLGGHWLYMTYHDEPGDYYVPDCGVWQTIPLSSISGETYLYIPSTACTSDPSQIVSEGGRHWIACEYDDLIEGNAPNWQREFMDTSRVCPVGDSIWVHPFSIIIDRITPNPWHPADSTHIDVRFHVEFEESYWDVDGAYFQLALGTSCKYLFERSNVLYVPHIWDGYSDTLNFGGYWPYDIGPPTTVTFNISCLALHNAEPVLGRASRCTTFVFIPKPVFDYNLELDALAGRGDTLLNTVTQEDFIQAFGPDSFFFQWWPNNTNLNTPDDWWEMTDGQLPSQALDFLGYHQNYTCDYYCFAANYARDARGDVDPEYLGVTSHGFLYEGMVRTPSVVFVGTILERIRNRSGYNADSAGFRKDVLVHTTMHELGHQILNDGRFGSAGPFPDDHVSHSGEIGDCCMHPNLYPSASVPNSYWGIWPSPHFCRYHYKEFSKYRRR